VAFRDVISADIGGKSLHQGLISNLVLNPEDSSFKVR